MSLSWPWNLPPAPGERRSARTIETEMSRDYFADPDFVASIQPSIPWVWAGGGRADAVEIPVLRPARWITGQELVVDGGRFVSKTPSLKE